ncbi:hypothetical protein [Desulfofustis limnaeus]|uniref:Major tail protein n=1 Tax=Desulfofustis limnaeus TaxID=2740163 RepID=A0ABN6M756_9BACT|nr:hypothetical protein [Desulfofustis limnaeus]BDD88703.1 hypothetical protein DPPLL_30680 [Desulfofustis limnaeus]
MSKQMQGFRGSLDLYYQVEQADGSFGPVYPAGNVTGFELVPDAEEMEIISTGNADYGQALDSMIEAKPTKGNFTVNRFNIDSWALAFMGEVEARTGTITEVTNEEVAAVPGEIFKLAHLDVSELVLTNVAGDVTYDVGDDYEIVDAALGLVRVKTAAEGGTIAAGTIHADYDAAAPSGWLLKAGTKSSKFIKLWGRGINRFNNKRSIVQVPRASVKPSGGFSIVGTDPASIQMDLTCNVPTDGSPVFTVVAEA